MSVALHRARLASGRWSGVTGRAFTRRAPAKGFQLTSCSLAPFPKLLAQSPFFPGKADARRERHLASSAGPAAGPHLPAGPPIRRGCILPYRVAQFQGKFLGHSWFPWRTRVEGAGVLPGRELLRLVLAGSILTGSPPFRTANHRRAAGASRSHRRIHRSARESCGQPRNGCGRRHSRDSRFPVARLSPAC